MPRPKAFAWVLQEGNVDTRVGEQWGEYDMRQTCIFDAWFLVHANGGLNDASLWKYRY